MAIRFVNYQRTPRPRGLGDLGMGLSGFGTWQIDRHWGLSPAYRTGFPAPYPIPPVRTRFPRAMMPRVLAGPPSPVVQRPYPEVRLPTMVHPLHKTPVVKPGARLTDDDGFGEYG